VPLDVNGIWQYEETDPASTFSDLLNLGTSSTSDAVGALAARVAVTELEDPAWTALTLNAGWANGAGWQPLSYRKVRGTVELSGGFLNRVGSSLAVTAGSIYEIATLPAGYRPSTVVPDAGTLGVGGALGSCVVRVDGDGRVRFMSLVASGTMVVPGSAIQNHVGIGQVRFDAA
jgi:hypothetical protein